MTPTDDLTVSFEFFPPKTPEMETQLWSAIRHLEGLNPSFVSVTYGAGGSTRERTHATVKRILDETKITPAAHLTCVGATRAEVDNVIRDYWNSGVRHIVALRGDPLEGMDAPYYPTPGGYENSVSLTRGIKDIGDFEISVACNPEKHPHSPSLDHDLDLLKKKVDNGATRAITQFFFDPDVYFRFVDRARKAGITIPIVPGIMPIVSEKGCEADGGEDSVDAAAKAPRNDRWPRPGAVDQAARLGASGRRTLRALARRRRHPLPFLHAQPRRAHVRHLPAARPPPRHRRGHGMNSFFVMAARCGDHPFISPLRRFI